MKPRPISASRFALPCFVTAAFLTAPSLQAASATWDGSTDGVWATGDNWSATPVPGTGDTATFDNAGGAVDTIDLGGGVTVRSLLFDTASAAIYTIGSGAVGSQTLNLENGGSITMNSTVTSNQTFNALVSLGDTVATYNIANNSTTNSLNFGEIRRANDGSNFALNVSGDGTINADRIAILAPGGGVTTLAKTGTGTLNLNGAADNRNLNLTVGGGIVVANKASSATVKAANLVTVNSGGTLQLAGTGGDQINNNITVNSGGVLDLNGRNEAQTTTRTVVLNGTGIGSAGALVNNAASTTSILSFDTGQVTLNSATSLGGVGNITINGAVVRSAGAGLTKVGAGTLTLSGTTDNASLILFVDSGTVVLNKTAASVRAASTATVNGGTLQLSGDNGDQIFGTLTVNGGIVDMNGKSEGLTAIIAASPGGTIYNTVDGTASTITLSGGGSGGTYAGVIADNAGGGQNGTMSLRQNNGGVTQTLTGSNTYSGGTRVSSGTLALSGGNNILADTGTVNVDGANGIFDISAVSTGETIGSLTGVASSNVVLGSKTLTVGNATNSTYAGVISGSGGSLTKQGAGILTLSGDNTYTGATTVLAGALLIGTSGSLANTAVTVGGATATGTPTLGGGGTIGGATTIAAAGGGVAGTHAPGVAGVSGGVGSQTFSNNLTYQSGSIFEWDINTAANTSDSLSVGGSLSVTSGAIFKIVSSTAFTDEFWNTTRNWNVFGGKDFDAFTLNFITNGISQVAGDFASEGNFTFTNSGSNLTWTAVPEPTSALAGILLGAGLLRRRRA